MYGEVTGAARLDREASKALRAGATPEQVAKITVEWFLGEITLEEAVKKLRNLEARHV